MKHIVRHIRLTVFAFAMAATAMASSAMNLSEAKKAFELGDFEEAAPVLAENAKRNPKDAKLNSMAGIALFYSGKESEAMTFLKRGDNEANMFMAEIEMHRYNFDAANEYLDRYEDGFKKRRRDPRPERPEASDIRQQIELGRTMLDRVEKIVIIDSIDVDRDSFFKSYRLSGPTGTLRSSEELPRNFTAADPTVVYATENADEIFWAAPDENEDFRLATSTLLADGTWEKPTLLPSLLNEGGDANYPFMSSDGVTLYYANTGKNSLGGYDIFISRRDGDTFYQPQNIGMPYNSYANDYLLAIDEITGAGWWATDRNAAPDRLTVYIFIPQELRVNYAPDTPGLENLALVKNFKNTWPENADYTRLLDAIRHVKTRNSDDTGNDFRFAMPTKGVYTSINDFKQPEARKLMNQYLELTRKLNLDRRRLEVLRTGYAKGNKSLSEEILTLESEVESLRDEIKGLSNRIVSAELNAR